MKYLALDQALNTSGWAIFYNTRLEKIGTIKTNPTHAIHIRLGSIWRRLDELLEKEHFEYVFLEDTQKQTNAETYKKLCYVQAVILVWCFHNNIDYMILSPSHWRKIIKDEFGVSFGRKREEQKKAAQEWVHKNFEDFTDATEDECDAICIGCAGIKEKNRNKSAF